MTRRERLEHKLQKRQEWAEKADARAETRFEIAYGAIDGIPPGQPILVGHHSERRHRNALEKHDRNMRKAFEEKDLATHHRSTADGLANALDSSIFSDDADAVEALTARIAEREADRTRMVAANKWWRKYKTMKGCPGYTDTQAERLDREIPNRYSWERQPYPGYSLSNLTGRIRADKQRLETVKRRAERTALAEASSTGVIIVKARSANWCSVTFAEKPTREILTALREAGYRWGNGQWNGYLDKLPPIVQTLEPTPTP